MLGRIVIGPVSGDGLARERRSWWHVEPDVSIWELVADVE